jgi:hypothetical protein
MNPAQSHPEGMATGRSPGPKVPGMAPFEPGPAPCRRSLYGALSTKHADRLLAGGLAGRDIDALTVVYDRYASTVMGDLLALGHDKATTEAVVAEVFCRLWRIAPWLDPGRVSLRVWLLLTARSLVDHRHRARTLEG